MIDSNILLKVMSFIGLSSDINHLLLHLLLRIGHIIFTPFLSILTLSVLSLSVLLLFTTIIPKITFIPLSPSNIIIILLHLLLLQIHSILDEPLKRLIRDDRLVNGHTSHFRVCLSLSHDIIDVHYYLTNGHWVQHLSEEHLELSQVILHYLGYVLH